MYYSIIHNRFQKEWLADRENMTPAYFESEKAKYVLQAATDMIQGLGLKVVAEGVEAAIFPSRLRKNGILNF